MRSILVAALCAASTATAAPGERVSSHLVYAEVGGKAGLYGLGYEHTITPRLALGVAGSYLVLRDQTLATIAPYVHGTIRRGARSTLFGELGAALVHSRVPSPVDDWDGMTDTGGGGFASIGWERTVRRHLVLRATGSIVVGEGGVSPWIGFAVGARP